MAYYVVFLLIAAVPSVLQILFGLSSYTQGFAINTVLVLCIILVSKRFARYLGVILKRVRPEMYLGLGLLAILHFVLIAWRWQQGYPTDFIKYFVGIGSFVGLGLQAAFLSYIVSRMVHKKDNAPVKWFVMTYLFFGIVGTFGYTVLGSFNERKPVFFDSEISHYALGLAPLYCVWTVLAKRWQVRWSGHLTVCLIGVLYQSTTLFIVLFSVILVTSTAAVSLPIIAAALGVLVLGGAQMAYYTNRLSFNFNENAMDNWAYLQGWQEAFLNFCDSRGLGVGLQQFGVMEPRGMIARAMFLKTDGGAVNRFDGGFGASKIIGEFGVLGIVCIILLTVLMARAARKLRSFRVISLQENVQMARVFAYSFIYVFFIYLFIRGGGYFAPNFVYLLAGLILLYIPGASSWKGSQ